VWSKSVTPPEIAIPRNIKPFLHVEAAGAQRAVDEDQGERIMLTGDAASSRRSA